MKVQRPKTVICDIDGTLIEHRGAASRHMSNSPKILPYVIDRLEEWDLKGYSIVLLTGRKESMRNKTEQQLEMCGIFYDQLIMGVGGGQRILINDLKPTDSDPNNPTAVAINLKRNEGLENVKI
jgi:hydroxymethylpyrimidine pyrophosphatase-like HAD family hydrolase